jgi:hypothetical protein
MVSDMGVEAGIPDCPDMLPAFFAWLRGDDLPDVDPNSYLFPLALAVGQQYFSSSAFWTTSATVLHTSRK